jgi:hypothetical protein
MFDVPRFMESLLSLLRMHWDHEPATDRSADSLVRAFGETGSRGQSCPRSETQFMESVLW